MKFIYLLSSLFCISAQGEGCSVSLPFYSHGYEHRCEAQKHNQYQKYLQDSFTEVENLKDMIPSTHFYDTKRYIYLNILCAYCLDTEPDLTLMHAMKKIVEQRKNSLFETIFTRKFLAIKIFCLALSEKYSCFKEATLDDDKNLCDDPEIYDSLLTEALQQPIYAHIFNQKAVSLNMIKVLVSAENLTRKGIGLNKAERLYYALDRLKYDSPLAEHQELIKQIRDNCLRQINPSLRHNPKS